MVRSYSKAALLAAIAIVFLVFSASNYEKVGIAIWPKLTVEMPKFLLVIMCFGLGMILEWLILTFKISKVKRLAKAEHKHVMALQNEVQALRAEQHIPNVRLPATEKTA